MSSVAARGRRAIQLVLYSALIGALAVIVAPSPRSVAATTGVLTTATSNTKLAAAISTTKYSSASTAVISEDVSGAVHVAANYASRKSIPLLVATSGTSASELTAQLSKWGTKTVYLVSRTTGYFTTGYRSNLTSAGITVAKYLQSSDGFALWVQAADPSTTSEYVLARSDDATAYRLATTYAGSRGSALLIWTSTTPAADLAKFFKSVEGSTLIFFGNRAVVPFDQMSEAQGEAAYNVDTADRKRAAVWTAKRLQYRGSTSSDVVTAPTSAIADLALAALRARNRGGVALPAGGRSAVTTDSSVSEYLTLWRTEATRVELVGIGTTSAQLDDLVAPTKTARKTAPAFRSTNLTYSDTSKKYSLSLTSVSGATKYVAYDLMGKALAQSTTPVLQFAEQPGHLLVSAEAGTTVKASFNLVVNSFRDSSQRTSVVLGQVSAGVAHLVILNTVKTPRLVIRKTVDAFGVEGPEIPVAITCQGTYTETGLNQSFQYTYSVADFTNVGVKACDTTLAAQAGTGVTNLGAVPLPATTTMAAGAKKAAPSLRQQKALKQAAATASTKRLPAGEFDWNTWPDVLVRWRAYIPEAKVPVGPSFKLTKPVYALGGDNAGSDPNGSARLVQTVQVGFGDNHKVTYSEKIGESHGYACNLSLSSCDELEHKTASLDTLNYRVTDSTVNFAAIDFDASSGVPLLPFSKYYAIDTSWTVVLSYYDSFAYGEHDNMPEHELWEGPAQSEWYRVYKSNYSGWYQAGCLFNPHGSAAPPCGTFFNVNL